MVDALGLGPSLERGGGSSPLLPTSILLNGIFEARDFFGFDLFRKKIILSRLHNN